MTNPSVAALEQRAIEFAKRGDFGADARSVNEEIARLAPTNQGAWTRLARCCMEMGLLDEATAALEAALQVNPQNTIAHNLQLEVSTRRAGPVEPAARRKRAASGTRSAAARSGVTATGRAIARKRSTLVLGGLGRAEFAALGQLEPHAAVESLTARLEPLLMAINDRPFAARVTDARNRAGHAGARLFRRGSILPGTRGHLRVFQQGGRWEPQLNLACFAAPQWGRDCLSAGIGFHLAEDGRDDRSDAGRERVFEYFDAFQQLIASTWRVHLTDWLRTNGGFIQLGNRLPATDALPSEAVASLIATPNPGELDWVFCGRWLFADRDEDIAILTDAPRLIRWIEQTFSDLLPLWGEVYRGGYRGGR
ncbi:MAG: tetratricopeptide repeat protein [Vicinamibacterales bacterium]